eukprot:CAMPEP_0113505244 /NCGR_PEP_ID=MMETSP0014_2-20120614/35199_1 /TAXON_ID=2857 /ORGANISM="Nitzschia sp." /LENGTH=1184 /DNA_ID=CAMNT_0000400515 /DNA_START=46 /DNA_END=3600 /DNA_ORIENTATION=+ /assembly_acc=CAM_ASM_000159
METTQEKEQKDTTKKNIGDLKSDDETGSNAELEGIDMEGIEDDDASPEDDVDVEDDADDLAVSDDNMEVEKLATEDHDELEAARQEQLELMKEEQKKVASQFASVAKGEEEEDDSTASPAEKLNYLLAQSDVFAHFLAGTVAAGAAGKKGSKGGRGSKKGRMTEAEEDAQMMRAAQSKRSVIRLDKQPSIIADHCKMHAYQLEGLNWLIKLHCNGINGILADEMGLGKTLQTISFLAYLREGRGVKGPHIVIVPKSVVGNWIKEFKNWCPSIRAIRMGGTKDERQVFEKVHLKKDETTGKFHWDVLVTSYEGILKEKNKLSKIDWRYLIIDEAHRIKNENSSLSKAVRFMKTEHRLLITGTPLQNNLRELWALLNFLMPEIFGDAEQFDAWFSLSDEAGKENVIKKLHTVLRPFMLRRVKKDVATALPPKKETKLYIGLTDMQQSWYVKILQKDAHTLNKLGGPDRLSLLNVLMQLRKICNHPYLFDGAEPGPPYTDGPHLWENSGKMLLLHKLLKKLKEKESRVLIFCQMTRILDILEDYCRLVGHKYCRIDGNTSGEMRDSQMEEFNAEGSEQFLFLLSTRAGGLGINLATADIVILYDSDWNPQVDLQAMDRAHRLGQKKPVQVFRFITEGTVEEKIIERADRKLFLDAAVIQQGRLAEQNTSLEKDELMKMVRFGADQILNKKGGTYSDEDIDALIARGEEKTSDIQAKLQTDVKHNLADFKLMSESEEGQGFMSFGGKDYSGGAGQVVGNFINLPSRERKRNYDVDGYFRQTMSVYSGPQGEMKAVVNEAAAKKRKKGPNFYDFQLFDQERLKEISDMERKLAEQKESYARRISELEARAKQTTDNDPAPGQSREDILKQASELKEGLDKLNLSEEEAEEKTRLLAEGFPDWTRADFKSFCSSLERYGRYNLAEVIEEFSKKTQKSDKEIARYFVAFMTNYRRINDWSRIMDKVAKGEQEIIRSREIRDAIQEKIERHIEDMFGQQYADPEEKSKVPSANEILQYTWTQMSINYGGATRNRSYTEESDAFLIYMMYRHGYGAVERIRMEIRRAWQFKFDFFFKSRSSDEIRKRCDMLVRVIEKENEELKQEESPTKDSQTDQKQEEEAEKSDGEKAQNETEEEKAETETEDENADTDDADADAEAESATSGDEEDDEEDGDDDDEDENDEPDESMEAEE